MSHRSKPVSVKTSSRPRSCHESMTCSTTAPARRSGLGSVVSWAMKSPTPGLSQCVARARVPWMRSARLADASSVIGFQPSGMARLNSSVSRSASSCVTAASAWTASTAVARALPSVVMASSPKAAVKALRRLPRENRPAEVTAVANPANSARSGRSRVKGRSAWRAVISL